MRRVALLWLLLAVACSLPRCPGGQVGEDPPPLADSLRGNSRAETEATCVAPRSPLRPSWMRTGSLCRSAYAPHGTFRLKECPSADIQMMDRPVTTLTCLSACRNPSPPFPPLQAFVDENWSARGRMFIYGATGHLGVGDSALFNPQVGGAKGGRGGGGASPCLFSELLMCSAVAPSLPRG